MKENQRVAVTKRMLKEGLLRLLETKELKKVKINELCEESGVNRATFYRHYETPLDVLLELEREITQKIFPLAAPPQTIVEAQIQLERSCTYIQEHANIMKILFRCNAETDLVNKSSEFYAQILELQGQSPQFADVDADTVKIILSLYGGGCYFLLRQWIIDEIPKTPAQIAAIVCNLIRWPDPKLLSGNYPSAETV